jgi:hypothetical protein
MKYRNRHTGEVVNIICWGGHTQRAENDYVSYIDGKGEEHEAERGLNYYWDFEPIEEPDKTQKEILQQLRENNQMLQEILAWIRLQKDPKFIEQKIQEDFIVDFLSNVEATKFIRKLGI